MGVLYALDAAKGRVNHTWNCVKVPRRVARAGLVAGGGALVMWALRRLFRRKPVVLPAVVGKSHTPSVYLLVQLISLVLLPWLRTRVFDLGWGDLVKRMHPARIFFRWIGLEK